MSSLLKLPFVLAIGFPLLMAVASYGVPPWLELLVGVPMAYGLASLFDDLLDRP